jgi:hypothetical protein
MTDRTLGLVALAFMLALIVAAALGLELAPARAAASDGAAPDYVLLGRIWVSERGWEAAPEEVALWQVLERRRRLFSRRRGAPVSLRTVMRAYASRATGARPTPPGTRLRWVSELGPACGEPSTWEESVTVAWSRYQDRCEGVFARARARLAGRDGRPSPCAESPDHWAARGSALYARAVRDGRAVDCGDTENGFYRAPRWGHAR